jgi:hypothetical protein
VTSKNRCGYLRNGRLQRPIALTQKAIFVYNSSVKRQHLIHTGGSEGGFFLSAAFGNGCGGADGVKPGLSMAGRVR